MNLYEINKQIENFDFEIDEETGEILNLDELDDLKLTRDEKIENIALYIKNLNADEKALDDEIKALQARKKEKQSKAYNLSCYLKTTLGSRNFETARCKLSWRKSKKVIIDNESAFINAFRFSDLVKHKEEFVIDKKETKKYLENNHSYFAHIEEFQNLQIK